MIVLGVLIALIVQQIAQAVKDRSDAAAARAAMRQEISLNLADLRNRLKTQRCIDRRLQEIDALLATVGTTRPYVRPGWIGRPQVWVLTHARFDAASQTGRNALLDGAEQEEFSTIYGAMTTIDSAQEQEQRAWAMLRGMEGVSVVLPPDAAVFRAALQDAKLLSWRINLHLVQVIDIARANGVPTVPPDRAGSQSICLALSTPRAEALRLLASPFGQP